MLHTRIARFDVIDTVALFWKKKSTKHALTFFFSRGATSELPRRVTGNRTDTLGNKQEPGSGRQSGTDYEAAREERRSSITATWESHPRNTTSGTRAAPPITDHQRSDRRLDN